MEPETLPLVVLAGSDRRPVDWLAAGGTGKRIWGLKGIDVEIGGRCLIDLVVERLRSAGEFGPIYIAGPAFAYGESRNGAAVIDTDSTFGQNLRAGLELVAARHPSRSVAFIAGDILPEIGELRQVLADYRAHEPLDFFFPMILVPEDLGRLGASVWKRQYRIVPAAGEEAVSVLPGHLVIVDPAALRRPLIYRSFELAYRSRGRPVLERLRFIVRHVLPYMLREELRRILRFRPPTFTASVIANGVAMARRLQAGVISRQELEERLHRIFVRSGHRRRFPQRRGRMPLVGALSLAKDIDTVEEARESSRHPG